MTPCRFIVDPPADGVWNMALDEALLLAAEQEGVAWLRFYTWQEPTLSLGYFQPHADRRRHPSSAGCALVRRASGGGAILHDRELTYSLALPASHPLSSRAEWLYDAAHQTLLETLREWGVHGVLYENNQPPGKSSADQPFLCFQRRSPGDLLVGPHKLAGSAQRRHHGAVLQHGSVLLGQSEFAPELPGIFDLSKIPAREEDFRDAWQSRLAARLEFRLERPPISTAIRATAQEISARKFATEEWTKRR